MTLPGPQDVGVVIGRFQVPALHAGHKKLLDQVFARHKRVLVLLGLPVWKGSKKYPLDYPTVKAMISEAYPTAIVEYVMNCQTNEEWSNNVDQTIRDLFPLENVTLYGGRDGFVRFYCGHFPTVETLEDPSIETESGTSLRAKVSALPLASEAFRAGVIYSSENLRARGPILCVDAAVVRKNTYFEVLLIQKTGETRWRFPGGHVDPTDISLETAVKREAREETGLEVGTPIYIGSDCNLADWRAMQGGMKIASALFYLPYIYGVGSAGDDAAEAKWFHLFSLTTDRMEDCHKPFLLQLQKWAEANQSLIANPQEVSV